MGVLIPRDGNLKQAFIQHTSKEASPAKENPQLNPFPPELTPFYPKDH